jgi:death-on-curing protein
VDGNKRAALVAAELFLAVNGFDLIADDVEVVKVFLALAAGEVSEEELAAWIDRNSRMREG